jgi:hypothetical protein
VVNVELLIKRPKKLVLPNGVIGLLGVWLENRSHFVIVDGIKSVLFDFLLGTIKVSVINF